MKYTFGSIESILVTAELMEGVYLAQSCTNSSYKYQLELDGKNLVGKTINVVIDYDSQLPYGEIVSRLNYFGAWLRSLVD